MANSAITVSSPNFATIVANIRAFMGGQSKYADWNFDGSNLSVLVDLLAFNTHQKAFYLNMVANEMFLQSAQLRRNVVDHAKHLNYIPSSMRGASATLQLTVTPTNTNIDTVRVPRNTQWSTSVDNVTLRFVTPDTVTIKKNANGAFVQNIEIIEGFPLTHRFTVSGANLAFVIPNDNVDTRSIVVDVQTSNTDTTSTRYVHTDDITNKLANSKIFFLEEEQDAKYEISFGDGIIGQKPVTGNVIKTRYRICNGTQGNEANSFTFDGNTIDGHSNVSFSLISAASGGVNRESIESIKHNAPKFFGAQNRAVTTTDYTGIIKNKFPEVQDVSSWGGQDNDPPKFGKVMLAMKPVSGDILADKQKNAIIAYLNKNNIGPIEPEIVDAETVYVEVDTTVKYDDKLTTLSGGDLKAQVITTIQNYDTDNLGLFGNTFRRSYLEKKIHALSDAILSVVTVVKMQKRFKPSTTTATKYTLNFYNAFEDPDPGTEDITHNATVNINTTFTYNGRTCYIKDDGNGTVFIYYLDSVTGKPVVVLENAGTVDYTTGQVILDSFLPTAITSGSTLKLTAVPKSPDIVSTQTSLLQIDSADIKVTMVKDE